MLPVATPGKRPSKEALEELHFPGSSGSGALRVLSGSAYVPEARSGTARMAVQQGGLSAVLLRTLGEGRVAGNLPDLKCQVGPRLAAPRKDGWALSRGGGTCDGD